MSLEEIYPTPEELNAARKRLVELSAAIPESRKPIRWRAYTNGQRDRRLVFTVEIATTEKPENAQAEIVRALAYLFPSVKVECK